MKFIYEQVDAGVSAGIFSPCLECTCFCPLLAVPKPGAPEGVWRLAQDFRELNKTTVINYFGLPDPMDMAINMAGSEYISELDLASAYWQIQIAQEDRYKTALHAT